MDTTKLRKFCNKLGVDPFVKEIMVERISKHEFENGYYVRPAVKQLADNSKEEKKGDMIEELLANEAQRKKEKAAQQLKEQAMLQKRKDLKALSIEDLKKRIAKKGLEATGKKEDMVEALFIVAMQEEMAIARKTELQAKSNRELEELLSINGLERGNKDQMIKTMLAFEKKCSQELRVFEEKVNELV